VAAAIAGAILAVAGRGLAAAPASPASAVQQASSALHALPYQADTRLVFQVAVRGGGAAARRGLPPGGLRERLTGELVADSPDRVMETLKGQGVPLGALSLVRYDGETYVSHDGGRHYYRVAGELRRFFSALEAEAGKLTTRGAAGAPALAGLRALAPRLVDGVSFAHYGGRIQLGDVSGVLGSVLSQTGAVPAKLARSLARALHFTGGRQDYWVNPQGVLVRQSSTFSARFDLAALVGQLGGPDAAPLHGVQLALRGSSALQVVGLGQPPSVARPTPVGTISTLRQLVLR